MSELSQQSGCWLCWDRHLLSWSWLYDPENICLNIFCVSSKFYFIWDTKFCSLAAHAIQSSWKRQKMHFQNLPHSPDHLAKPWPLSRGLSEWRWKIPAECSTSEHHFILWSSPDYWRQAVRADWCLPFCLQTAWSSLGFFSKEMLSKSWLRQHDYFICRQNPSRFDICCLLSKGMDGITKEVTRGHKVLSLSLPAEAQAPGGKLAWCRDQSPLVLVIAQVVQGVRKDLSWCQITLTWVVTTVPIQGKILPTSLSVSV